MAEPRTVQITRREASTAEWAASTLVLGLGEEGLDTTTGRIRRGDGTNVWASLSSETEITGTGTIDYGSIAAGAVGTGTVTVTGAVVGDSVAVGVPSTFNTGLLAFGYVSAADTVTIRVINGTAGAIDPASGTYRATVVR